MTSYTKVSGTGPRSRACSDIESLILMTPATYIYISVHLLQKCIFSAINSLPLSRPGGELPLPSASDAASRGPCFGGVWGRKRGSKL